MAAIMQGGKGQLVSVNINTIVEKNYTLLFYPFYAQKALFIVPKICNINFWIENNHPPPFGIFPKIHPFWYPDNPKKSFFAEKFRQYQGFQTHFWKERLNGSLKGITLQVLNSYTISQSYNL